MKVAGTLTGFDWQSLVDQLINIERTPITRLETEQAKNESKITALDTLKTKMTALNTAAAALKADGLFTKRSISSSTTDSTWSLSAASGATAGTYNINVTTLATAAKLTGSSNIGSSLSDSSDVSSLTLATLPTASTIKAGTFSVNGSKVTIATTDTLQEVFDKINTATSGAVTASYSAGSDTISLSSASSISIGASNDTSNFLSAMKLSNATNTGTLTSTGTLGALSTSIALDNNRFATSLTSGAGSFSINGVDISYDTTSDTLKTIISKINASSAGVTASYDATNDRMVLTNTNTGDLGLSLSDTTGNLMETLGMTTGASFTTGKNAVFTVNDGPQQSSLSNTFGDEQLGTTGISVTANSTGTQSITVSNNSTDGKTAIESFISAFNDVQDYIDTKTAITKTSGKVTTGVLASNHEVQAWSTKMRNLAFSALSSVSGDVSRLEDMGIDFISGTVKLQVKDSSKLTAALESSTSGISDFFSNSSTGFVKRFSDYMTTIIGDDVTKGWLTESSTNLTNANKSLDDQIAAIERRLEIQRSTLETQYQAMESYQTKANNIMSQLSKSFFS